MMDNSYYSKEAPILSRAEIAQLIDIASPSGFLNNSQLQLLASTYNIPNDMLDIASFVISSGMIKSDEKYTFKSDEEIFENLSYLYNNPNSLPSFVDTDLIYDVFSAYEDLRKSYENVEYPPFEEYCSLSLEDLFKFKNQLACEALCDYMRNKNLSMVGRPDCTTLRIYENINDDLSEEAKKLDNIKCAKFFDTSFEFSTNIDNSTTVSELGREFSKLQTAVKTIIPNNKNDIENIDM